MPRLPRGISFERRLRSDRGLVDPDLLPTARLFALRALVGSDSVYVWESIMHPAMPDSYAAALGLELPGARTKKKLLLKAHDQIHVLEAAPSASAMLFDNVKLFSDAIGLTEVERALLGLVLLVHNVPFLEQVLERALMYGDSKLDALLAGVLAMDVGRVREAIWPDARLFRLRLLRKGVDDSLFPLSVADGMKQMFSRPHTSQDALLANFFRPLPATTLTLADFAHLGSTLDTMAAFLAGARRDKLRGVNVLLHGPTGAGKTALAATVGSAIGAKVQTVLAAGADGEPLSREQRLAAFSLSQHMLETGEPALVVFDEIEDVFERPMFTFFGSESRGRDKAWTNSLLEGNPVPTIWITNRIDVLDPAFLRRFDMVLEVGRVPPSMRRKLIDRALGESGVSDVVRQRFAGDDRVTPAVVEQSIRVATAASGGDAVTTERLFVQVLASRLDQERRTNTVSSPCVATSYELGYINADCDPVGLIESLREEPKAALCFVGAPGTGKSAYAAKLAESLGFDLIVRRASDLLGMFVGETEKNIASMFSEARRPRTVLFLDEADSFLAARSGARARWEVSLVNEMLVQMEQHEGVFVCATNLVEAFDEAALRRFSAVVKFESLRPEQRRAMFFATIATLGIDAGTVGPDRLDQLDRLDGLAPGDYHGAVKQMRFTRAVRTGDALLGLLRERLDIRRGRTGKAMGFM